MKRPEPKPFLSTTTDRDAAFPDIESMTVVVEQDPSGHYSQNEWQRKSTYTKHSIPKLASCLNSRCKEGGLDLQNVASFSSNGVHTYYCGGHEGSPKGRRKGIFGVPWPGRTAAAPGNRLARDGQSKTWVRFAPSSGRWSAIF
jgi:hypothetical protein